VFLGVSRAPILRVRGTIVPIISWDPLYMRAHDMRNSNQILHDDQTGQKNCDLDADARSVCGS